MKAVPTSGSLTTVFTITWASGAPPSGYKFDVQIKRPGDTDFSDWFPTHDAQDDDVHPGRRDGRVQLPGAPAQHGERRDDLNCSAPVSITVNP